MTTFMPNDPYTGRPHGFRPFAGGAGYRLNANSYGGHTGACHANCSCGEQASFNAQDLAGMIAAAIRKHVGPAQESEQEVIERIVTESIRATAERDRSLQKLNEVTPHLLRQAAIMSADHDDPAVAAMVAPSSLQVYRELRGQAPGADPLVAQHIRKARNLDALARGTLPNEGGLNMRDAVEVAADDPTVAAMTAHSTSMRSEVALRAHLLKSAPAAGKRS